MSYTKVTNLRGKVVIWLPEDTKRVELTPQQARRLATALAQRADVPKRRRRKRGKNLRA